MLASACASVENRPALIAAASAPRPAGERLVRVAGLDSLRFLLALVVTLAHWSLSFQLIGIDLSSGIGWWVNVLYRHSLNGTAAVIGFFVISGFCIHFPFRDGQLPPLGRYYLRRYLRIGVPVAVAMLVAPLLDLRYSHFNDSILWTLVCEEIYYALYPLLLLLRQWLGWQRLLPAVYVVAQGVALSVPESGLFPYYGWYLNWLVCLPNWLLGCMLAEQFATLPQAPRRRLLVSMRLGVFLTSVIILVLHVHTTIGYAYTLNGFGLLAYYWLKQEIAHFRTHPPWPVLEWAGKWSYSMYLMHLPAMKLLPWLGLPIRGLLVVNWFVSFAALLGICYTFYLLVEKPSHALCRRIRLR